METLETRAHESSRERKPPTLPGDETDTKAGRT